MSTELQQQVSALRKKHIQAVPLHKGRPSIFLTPSEAAAVDVKDIYDAAIEGLSTLCQYEGNLRPFFDSLLHPSSVDLQRELKTPEENAALDIQLNKLLQHLSLFAFEPQCHLVLEYLIRRYRVHELNVDALIKAMLVAHDTKIFAKVVSLCRIEDTIWAFLCGVKASVVPLPRSILVRECGDTHTVLEIVCNIAENCVNSVTSTVHNPTELVCSSAQKIVAFSVATVLELLEARGANDQRVRHLFLFVVNGLKCIHGEHIRTISSAEIQPILSDWCKGSCMIIALLSKKVTFTKPLMKSIVTNLTNSFIASVNGTYIDVVDRILDVFLILSNSQKLKHIGKLIDALCYSDKPQFVHEFVALLERKNETYDIRPFVMKLLDCIIQEMTELVSSNSKKANTNSVGKVDKTADLACRLISITDSSVAITALKGVLTIVITIKVSDTKILSGCYSIIQSVSNLYSSEFDEVIKVILSNIEKTSTTDGRNPTEVKASINKFLQNTFAGQKYKLPDSSGTSLLLGLNSPVEQIKIASLHSFHKLISSSSNEDRPEYVKDMQGLSVAACACMTSHSMDVSIAAWNSNISKIVAKYAVHDLYLSLSYSHQHWLQSFLVDKNKSSCEVLMNIWSSINEDSVLHALSASDNSSESNLLAANRIEWLFRTVLDLLCKAKANFVAESDGKQSSNDLWVKSTNLYYSMAVSLGKILPIWKGLNVVNKTNSVSTLFEKCVDVMSKNCKSHSSIALLERYCNQSYTNYSFDKNLSNIIASLELIVGISSNCSDDEIKEKILTFVIPLFALACENCATEDEGMQDLLVQLTQNLVIAIGNSDTYANSANVLPEIDGSEISDLLSSLRSGVSIADIRGRVACAILSSVGSKVITELGNTLTVFYGKNPHKYLLSIAGSNSVDEKSGRCLLNSSFLMWTEVEDAVDTKVIITNVMKAVALQALATYVMSMFSRSSNTATLSTSDSASIMILLPIIISCCCDASDIVRAASLAIIKRIGRLKSAVSKLSIEASVSNYFKKLTGSALEESVFSNLVSICNLIAEKEVLISIDAAAGRTLLISEILPTNVQNDNIVMILLFTVTLMSRADITTATIILDCVVGINMLDQSWVFIQEMLCHFLTVSDIKTSVYARIAVKSLLQFNHCESYETQENIIEWLSALLESDTEENDILVDVKNEVFKLTINGSFSEADEPLLVKLYSSLIMEQLLRPGKELVLTAIRSLTVSITTPIKFLYNECKVLLNSLQSVPRESKLEDQEEGSGLALPVEKLCSLLEAVNFAFQQATDDVSIELGAITVVLFETLSALNTAQLKKIMQVEYCKCMIIDVTYYCLSVARSSIQASSVLISKTASARKSKSSKDFMEVMIDDIKLDKYASNRVEADIMRILTCLEFNGASALIQSSALKLLVLLLEINPSALLSSIKQLGDLLAKSTVVEAVNNREIIVGIMQIFTGVVSSDSCNLTWEEVFESLCQEFHNIKSFQRRQILDFVLSSTNKDEQEGLALSSIVNVLLNQTYAVSNLEESSESKSQSTFSTDTATITTILLSKSAKRKALKALATTTSEEMYMLAKEIILSRPSPIAIISTLINIISDTMDTLEGVLQIKGKMNTDDNNTLEKWERITEYCKLISSSSNIPMESLLSTRMVLQLQFIQDILEDKRLHRAIAAFIDEAGSDSLLQDQYLQFADALLQLLANANDVEERYYKSNEAVAITTSKETFTLPLSLLGLDVGSWCNKIIANVQNMMDTPSFITILQELLSHERLEVRQKAIHVLGGRLENLSKHDLKNIDEVELYVELNQNLRKAITDSHAKLSSVKALIETSNGADINTKSKKRKDTTVSIEWTSTNRTEISLAQSSLICIDILSKHLGKFKKNTSELCDTFKELWEFLVVINSIITLDLGKRTSENRTIFKIVEEVIKLGGSLFLCIGSICKSLGAEILTNLEELMSITLSCMQYQITAISVEHSAEISDDDTNTVESLYKPRLLLLRTIISSISLIVMGTPLFFHPYIEKTLTSLLVLQQIKSIPDFAAVNEDITKCLTILATTVPPRLSIPVLLKATPALMKSGHSQAYYFVQLVKIIYTNLDRQTIVAHMQSLIVIATLLLDYHRVYGDRSELSMTISTISSEAIIELLLKFTETELKSFLLKLSEWRDIFIANIISVFKVDSSNSNVIGNKRKDVDYDISISDVDSWQVFARSSSFYSILKLLSDRLQELFTPIMGLFWINASELLAITIHLTYNINIGNNANAVANIDDSSKKKKKKITEGSSVIDTTKVVDVCTELTIVAANIMDCVRSCCDNDASSFLDQHRFELMVPKIVKLLSYRNVFASNAAYYSYCEEHVMPCLSSVALAVGSDVLWKPINHKILIMTRSDKVSVRIVAIKTIKHLFHEVGEDYLMLLPECLPFFSELLEDSNKEVTVLVAETIRFIEDLSGEKLDDYM